MTNIPAHEIGSGNVFADLGLPDAQELLLKSEIVAELARLLKSKKLSQAKAAALIGVAQPDLSNLLGGKLRGFSVERLLHMIAALGRDIEIVVKPARRSKEQGGIRFRRAAA
jgi:predicted XRE-type DNA-binding protein